MILRWATSADTEELATFNARLHSDTAEPDEWVYHWTKELMGSDHPTTNPADFTVVVDQSAGGRIVSSMNLISQTWSYEGIKFGLGRPEAVATEPNYRRKRLVRQQFEVIHALSAARGELMQAITGIPWYYRQFGYEMALDLSGGRRLYWPNLSKLEPGQTERFSLRPATLQDLTDLQRFYALACAYGPVARVRDETQWRYELQCEFFKSLSYHRFYLIEEIGDGAVGYIEAIPDRLDGPLVVRELAVRPDYSLRMVAEFLTRALRKLADEINQGRPPEKAVPYLGFSLGAAHPVYTALGQQLEKLLPSYAWFIRVADLAAFLRRIGPALEKRVENSPVAGHSGTLRINLYRQHLSLTFEGGKLTEVGSYEPTRLADGDALFPDLTFLHLLMGHRSLAELRYMFADCTARGERNTLLLETLFPPRPSSIAPLN